MRLRVAVLVLATGGLWSLLRLLPTGLPGAGSGALAVAVVALAVTVGCAARRRTERGPWWLAAVAVAGWGIPAVAGAVHAGGPGAVPPHAGELGAALFALALALALGLLVFARAPGLTRAERADSVAVGCAVGSLVIGPAVASLAPAGGGPVLGALGITATLAGLVLFSASASMLMTAGRRADRGIVLLAAAALCFEATRGVAGDLLRASALPPGALDALGWLVPLAIALAAWSAPARPAPMPAGERGFGDLVPVVAGVTAVGVLLTHSVATAPLAVADAAMGVAAVLGRLLVAAQENRALLAAARVEAHTDALTGLGNRRALTARFEHGAPRVLALLDLDGFKAFNDAYGHPAGDALLADVGRRLEAVVPAGAAFRLGGDEFCALLDGDEAPEQVERRIAAALGEGLGVRCSVGAVALPTGGDGVGASESAALQAADERLYTAKRAAHAAGPRPTGVPA